MNAPISLLIGSLILSIFIGSTNGDPRSHFVVINERLVAAGADKNIKAAINGAEIILGKEKKRFLKSTSFVRALKKFVELKYIQGDKHCNQRAFDILTFNNEAINPEESSPPSIVKQVVDYYTLQHAKHCRNIYPIHFRKLYEKLNRVAVERVEALANDAVLLKEGVIRSSVGRTELMEILKDRELRLRLYHTYVLREPPKVQETDCINAVSKISRFTREVGDPERFFLTGTEYPGHSDEVNRSKVKKLFQTYIVKPCDYFIRKLGPELFKPAQFDLSKMTKSGAYNLNSENEIEFNISWIQYRYCEFVLKYQPSISDGVIQLVMRETKERQRRTRLRGAPVI